MLCAGFTHAEAALVANGGFETGDLTGWTLSSESSLSGVDDASPYLGEYSFFSGDSVPVTLSQFVATDAGVAYTLSFWLKNDSGDSPNSFSVLIDGETIGGIEDGGSSTYTNFLYDFIALGSTTALAFVILNETGYWDLDDVSVETSGQSGSGFTVVPVPTGLPLLATGLGGLALAGWQRQKKNKTAA